MYCTNCGKENEPGSLCCLHCGSAMPADPENNANEETGKARDSKKGIVIALGVLSAALAIVIVLSVTGVFGTAIEAVPSKSAQPLEDVINFLFADSGDEGLMPSTVEDTNITPSTIEREPLPEGMVIETDYYTDETGQLKNESELLPGLKYFYNKTGVQPYVYLTGTINGSTETPVADEMQEFAESKYRELFTDEAHVLLVVFENDYSYRYWYTVGPRARSVMDEEAGAILGNYIDKYYNDMSLSYEQFFSRVFSKTADRIMSVTAQ